MSFGDANMLETFTGPYTALPVQIFNFARLPGADWGVNAAAASVVILVLVLAVNGLAIYLRNRFEKQWCPAPDPTTVQLPDAEPPDGRMMNVET